MHNMEHFVIFKCILHKILHLISPTHKRTEGPAPVWGSELTSKDAALQGGSEKLLNAKLCDLRGGGGWWWLHLALFLAQSFTTKKLKADTEIKSRKIWGLVKWYYFCERQFAPSPRWAAKGQCES